MSIPRKAGPVRQLSLRTETPTRRKGLKKQYSEDIPDTKQKWIPELGFHVSLCTKTQVKLLDRPPPAKLAWIENHHQDTNSTKNEEGIVAKKCKEIKRPVTAKITRQSSLNKDSILLSHQELAERLRQAWKDREKGKQNLNIFLAHNVKEKQEEDFNSDLTEPEGTLTQENAFTKTNSQIKPKIILPLKPSMLPTNEITYKNIFQKRMRRAHSIDETLKDIAYTPSRTLDMRTKTVVVVPLAESIKPKQNTNPNLKIPELTIEEPKIEPKLKDEEKPKLEAPKSPELDKPIDVIIRPITASIKRDGFRNRTNSAFTGSGAKENQRPPLVRAASVPLKPAQSKPKFTAVKRRIKSASKRKEKSEKSVEDEQEQEFIGEENEEEREEAKNKNKKFQRCVSVSGAEIITMVSLVSPEESEAEEPIEVEKEKPKPKTNSPIKVVNGEKSEKMEHQKNFMLRKVAKSVSFQQSTIHAVRSFSASFPARRGSIATSLMLNNGGSSKAAGGTQEKRGTFENVADDGREPKRRLLRTKSAPSDSSFDDKEEETSPSSLKPIEKSTSQSKTEQTQSSPKSCLKEEEKEPLNSEENPNGDPTFDTPKEKQCWEMYRKMSDKGVSISFDTILRGMLTPTEYRLRRKSVPAADTNTDNIADS